MRQNNVRCSSGFLVLAVGDSGKTMVCELWSAFWLTVSGLHTATFVEAALELCCVAERPNAECSVSVLCEVCCSLALRFGVPSVGFRCVPSSKLRCPQFEIPVSPVRGFCVSRVQGLCVSSLRFPCLQFEFPACLPFKVRLSPAWGSCVSNFRLPCIQSEVPASPVWGSWVSSLRLPFLQFEEYVFTLIFPCLQFGGPVSPVRNSCVSRFRVMNNSHFLHGD